MQQNTNQTRQINKRSFQNCKHLNKQEQMCSSPQDKSVMARRFVPLFTPSGGTCSWLFVYHLSLQTDLSGKVTSQNLSSYCPQVQSLFLLQIDWKYFDHLTSKYQLPGKCIFACGESWNMLHVLDSIRYSGLNISEMLKMRFTPKRFPVFSSTSSMGLVWLSGLKKNPHPQIRTAQTFPRPTHTHRLQIIHIYACHISLTSYLVHLKLT